MNSKNSLWSGLFFIIFMLCLPGGPAQANIVGGNYPPEECPSCCEDNKNRVSCTTCSPANKPCSISPSQGNLCQTESLVSTKSSGSGFNLQFSLTYSSSNADNSSAFLDIGMGYGWTHSYSTLLFTQRGNMFRLDSDGTVTRYQRGAGNTYVPTRGYFETLVSNSDGTFTLRQKDGTTYQFAKITGDTLSINGPVWRLTSVTDKDGNSLTLTYSGGRLTTVTDTYGRVLTLTYNNQGHLDIGVRDFFI